MKRRVGVLAVMLALAMGSVPLSAQVGPPPGAGQRRGQEGGRQELERRLQARFGLMLQNQLGLTAAQMGALQGVMQSFQEERQTLNRSQASLRYRLRDPGLQDLAEEEARAILQEMIQLQEQELSLYKREQERLLTVLSPKQLVLFYRYREDLGRRIQELRQGGGIGPGGGVPGVGEDPLTSGPGRGGGIRFR